jgi:hypothetical protein
MNFTVFSSSSFDQECSAVSARRWKLTQRVTGAFAGVPQTRAIISWLRTTPASEEFGSAR